MRLRGAAARSPLFLRIFLLLLLCVGVVQLMNLALLFAVQPPTQKVYTVGQIAAVLARGNDPAGDFQVSRRRGLPEVAWNPRAERLGWAVAAVLGAPAERVRLNFTTPFPQREPVYDRASVPRTSPLPAATARDVLVVGRFTVALAGADGVWTVVEPVGGFEPWRWLGLLWLVVSALAVAPFAWVLARRISKPIAAFSAAAERLGRNPRAAPLALEGPAEIADAATAFNRMQAELNRYVDDRTTIIGALAHDLRTPLMRMGLRLESASDEVRTACEADIRDMQSMISATVAYVRDTGQPAMRRLLDLRALAETITDDMSDRGEPVSLVPGGPVVVEGNSAALKAMLSNLVNNAVKYAGSAEVLLIRGESQAIIEVRDRGPGIPPDDLAHVFEPFFRGERSRNRDTGGMGLGLASARAVARAHGGEIAIHNRDDGGVTARVTLPL
jgi:two-component system OmpR family sensor kinase